MLYLHVNYQLWIALVVATNSSAWLGTVVVVTNMRNFPLSRGTVAGLLKGYAGLSAAVYTAIYAGILHNSSTRLLLLLTLGIPFISISLMSLVRPCTPASRENSTEGGHFLFIQASSVILGLYLLTTTVLDDALSLNDAISYSLVGGMVFLLLAPLGIPLKMTLFPVTDKKSGPSAPVNPEEPELTELLLSKSSSSGILRSFQELDDASEMGILLAEGEGAVKMKRRPRRGDDFRFREALVKADFWLLFMVYFLGVGSGVTVLNNLAQIATASYVEDTTILLTLFSFCNFIGRLGGGVISEHFVR